MNKKDVISFFDRCAPTWDAEMVTDDKKIGFILDTAGVSKGAKVLDVACGTGVLFPYYLSREVSTVTGVDISPEMVRIAKGKLKGEHIEVICGDMETIPVKGEYDCCVIYNAFPHFADPAALLERLALWIKAGGRLTVAHGMGLSTLRRHHEGRARAVSREMLSAEKLGEVMSTRFKADVMISTDDIYVVSGVKR